MYNSDSIKNRIFISGANGMLGQRVVNFYSQKVNIELLACSLEEKSITNNVEYFSCDITNREKTKSAVYDFCPDYILNLAAYTNVDLSEVEREKAWKANVKAVEYLVEAARNIDAHIIHISSDYIFDGKNGPYNEDAVPNPVGYYGRTKLASENVLKMNGVINTILRTNVLYGVAINHNSDFVNWLVNALRKNESVRIVTDQINNPTFTDDMVQAISKVIEFRKTGIYNIGGKEFISRYEFTHIISDFFNLDKSLITPIKTEELNQKARRPLKSGLITLKAESELGYKPHTIPEALSIIKKELNL
ncbi:MAG TPA: SDR family oxidoreductase [Ignavibacteriaceae bacterium]|nr:SDR family oxidoreductase [Ignavibacteriaceae bacterium]